ncbi:MAG: hypothetical protein ACRDGG_02320, partial [Anaerolineae bacterium]
GWTNRRLILMTWPPTHRWRRSSAKSCSPVSAKAYSTSPGIGDTPDEMKAYIAEKWTYTRLRKAVLTRVRRLMASAGEGARVRVLGNIVISRWRKQPKV